MKNVLGQDIFSSQSEKEAMYDVLYPNHVISREDFERRIANRGKDDYFFEKVIPFLEEHEDIKTVLDVGADHGRYSSFMHNVGLEVTAIEISPARTKHLQDTLLSYGYPDIKVEMADIETYDMGDFDFVFCSDIIEHLEDYMATWGKIMLHSKYVYALIPKENSWNWARDHTIFFNDAKIENLNNASGEVIFCDIVTFDENNNWYALLVKGKL